MYLGNMQDELTDSHSNFLGALFQEEKGFGDEVAADLKAIEDAQTKKGLTKTAKAGIAVGVAGLLLVGGYLVIKKLKKK